MHHPSGIPEKIVRKVVARRGRLHAFESIEPGRTALVVIDLDTATVGSSEECQRLVPRVNELASAVRSAGGSVAWVTSHMSIMPRHFAAIVGDELATKYFNDGQQHGAGTTLWHELDTSTHDVVAVKSGASAFFPGKCNLKEQLDRLEIDTLLIAGAVTNICCESSARDAVELDYKVIMVSDVLSGHAHGLHEATLATFYRIFGDVRPSGEVMELLCTTKSPDRPPQPARREADPRVTDRNRLTFDGRLRSIAFALRGIRTMLVSQHNAWIHAAATVVVVATGLILGLSWAEWCWIVLAVVAVWTAEALNTAFEFLTDVASPNFHPIAGKAKDVAAGAVLLAALGAVIIGALVFGPKVWARL